MVSLFFPSLSIIIWDIFLTLKGFYQNHVLPLVMVVVALEILETSQESKVPFYFDTNGLGLGLGLGLSGLSISQSV